MQTPEAPAEAPAAAPVTWHAFTPTEVSSVCCQARTWGGGKGGQCPRVKPEGSDFCVNHTKGDKWMVHGRVSGEIPAAKLAEFVREAEAAPNRTPKKPKEPKAPKEMATKAPKAPKEPNPSAVAKKPAGVKQAILKKPAGDTKKKPSGA